MRKTIFGWSNSEPIYGITLENESQVKQVLDPLAGVNQNVVQVGGGLDALLFGKNLTYQILKGSRRVFKTIRNHAELKLAPSGHQKGGILA